jgi:hypothetical protein
MTKNTIRNWKQICSGILLGSLVSCTGAPDDRTHVTTDQLNQAICIEDWEGAIAILDNIIPDYPDSQNTLAEYRDRLQQLSTTGLGEEQKAQYCSPGHPISPNPNPVPQDENSLTRRVWRYYDEELWDYIHTSREPFDSDGRSYEEITTFVEFPGRISNLDYYYSWIAENGTYLAATFSDDQLEELSADEVIDCQENNECDRISPPAEFERLVERFEAGMNAQAVLQAIVRELGEPSYQREKVVYSWQFQEGETFCTIDIDFSNDKFIGSSFGCGMLPES